jgi:hypothetical protein
MSDTTARAQCRAARGLSCGGWITRRTPSPTRGAGENTGGKFDGARRGLGSDHRNSSLAGESPYRARDKCGKCAGYYPAAASGVIPTDEIRISVINLSSRAVSLLRGDVLLDKDKSGTIVGAASDSSVSDRGGGEPAPLPFTFSPDTSSKACLQWRASASRRLGETATRLPLTKRKLSVRLELEPGDPQTVPVQTGQVPQELGGWSALLRLRSNEVVGWSCRPGRQAAGPLWEHFNYGRPSRAVVAAI